MAGDGRKAKVETFYSDVMPREAHLAVGVYVMTVKDMLIEHRH